MASTSSPQERQRKRIKDLDEKWKMLFNEKPRPPLYSVDKYIEYLRKFTSSSLDESINSRTSDRSGNSNTVSDQQISYLLKKLKLDLNMAYERFLEAFVCGPNYGLKLLLTLLKNIQKASGENAKGTAKEKMQFKKRKISEELECILCIKFCLRYKESVKILLEVPYGLENVAEALLSSNFRSRCTALEIMSKVLMEDKGFHRNLECFTYFRLKNCEPVRFKFLINMLMSAGSSNVQVSFQLHCMKFLNSLLTSSPDGNARIFLQSEIEMAGLDVKSLLKSVDLKTTDDKDQLKLEIMEYKNGLLDVDQLLESHETLYKLNMELQRKVFMLQEQLQVVRCLDNSKVSTHSDQTLNHNRDQHEQDHLIAEFDQLLDSFENESRISEPVDQPVVVHAINTPHLRRKGSNRNWKKAGHPLPVLRKKEKENVTPLSYKCIDPDEKVNHGTERKPDFNQNFEKDDTSSSASKITFIEQNRAENFLSVQREIGLPTEVVVECIQNCDTEDLSAENVSSLLNLLPTENEMRNILTLECELENLGDAEQFLVQLMSVERLGDKLMLMQFLYHFNDTVDSEIEKISEIQNVIASLHICDRFKRFVEISKSFMVDNFYSTPLDFRLSSLFEFDATGTNDNILRDIALSIRQLHPDVFKWYEDVPEDLRTKASMKDLMKYIEDNKEGLKALETELSKSESEDLSKLYACVCNKFENLQNRYQDLQRQYNEMCKTFQEPDCSLEPQELFTGVVNLSESYKTVVTNLPPFQETSEPEPDYGDITIPASESNQSSSELTETTDFDTSGLYTPERIKDWIVMTSSVCVNNTDVNSKTYPAKRDNVFTKEHDSDSDDSAFEGSGGSCLKKFVTTDSPMVQQRSSTPMYFNLNEPVPDYSRSNSPDYLAKDDDDIGSEVSRILREFEGDLNGYETHINVPHDRRFYTIHSIIHL